MSPSKSSLPLNSAAPLAIDALSTALVATLSNAAVYPISTIVARIQTQRHLIQAHRDAPPASRREREKYLVDQGAFGESSGASSFLEKGKEKLRRPGFGRRRSSSSSSDDEGRSKSQIKLDRKLGKKVEENLIREGGDLYAGVMDAYVKIVRKEGIRGFYRGLVDDSIETFVATLLYIGAYNALKKSPAAKYNNIVAANFPAIVATLLSHLISPILLPSITAQQVRPPKTQLVAKSFWPSYLLSVSAALLKHFFSQAASSPNAQSKNFLVKFAKKMLAVFLTYPIAVLKTCHNLEIPAKKVLNMGLAGIFGGVEAELVRSAGDYVISHTLTPVLYSLLMAVYVLYAQGMQKGREVVEKGKDLVKDVAGEVVKKTEVTKVMTIPAGAPPEVIKQKMLEMRSSSSSSSPYPSSSAVERQYVYPPAGGVSMRREVRGREKRFEREARRSLRRHWEVQPREPVIVGTVNLLEKGAGWEGASGIRRYY